MLHIKREDIEFTLRHHLNTFLINNNLLFMNQILAVCAERSCLTGGTMVKLLHGNVQKMQYGNDLDFYFSNPKNHSKEKLKSYFKRIYGANTYTPEELYDYIIYYEAKKGVDLLRSGKINPALFNKLVTNSTLQYSNLMMLPRKIEDIMEDPSLVLDSYVDVITGKNTIPNHIATYDITICMVALFYTIDGTLQLKVDNQRDHVYKNMKAACRGDVFLHYHNTIPKTIKFKKHKIAIAKKTHKHFERLLKYVNRGFRLDNTVQLYGFFLWLLSNKLINPRDSHILQRLTEGLYSPGLMMNVAKDRLLYCRL